METEIVLGLHINEDNSKCGKENAAAHISYLNGSGLGRLCEKLSEVLNTPLPPYPNSLCRTHESCSDFSFLVGVVEKAGL